MQGKGLVRELKKFDEHIALGGLWSGGSYETVRVWVSEVTGLDVPNGAKFKNLDILRSEGFPVTVKVAISGSHKSVRLPKSGLDLSF